MPGSAETAAVSRPSRRDKASVVDGPVVGELASDVAATGKSKAPVEPVGDREKEEDGAAGTGENGLEQPTLAGGGSP